MSGSGRGSLGDNIGLKDETIIKACSLAVKAHKSGKEYKKKKTSSETYVIISFPGSWVETDWFVGKKKSSFGETKVDLGLLPSLRSVGNDEAALVNEAFFNRFDRLLKLNKVPSFKYEVNKAMADGKKIVFTGHSSGAVVAILATFWTLEEYLNPTKIQDHYKPPLCLTFGSPLIGNHILSHASRRENWSQYFIHFVMRYDIVPRILLAPFSSIEKLFSPILQLLKSKSTSTHGSIGANNNENSEFFSTVMKNARTVTSHAASNLMGNTNSLLETVTNFVELSPYRPFGTYIFCDGNGQLTVVKNSDAVLQLLYHTAQPNDLTELSEVVNKSIEQHLDYKGELEKSFGKKNVVYLDKLDDLPLSADGANNSNIAAALDSLGLDAEARLCLRAAGMWEKHKQQNEEKFENEIQEKAVAGIKELEEYKATCELNKGKGYYDAFKLQKDEKDFKANVKRLVLAGIWDERMEMLKRYELPDKFEGNPEWIKCGKILRRLMEPLDIANYYRHLKNKDTGAYMKDGRPKRYRYTQRWLEHANRLPKEVFTESTFWAEVEELCILIGDNKPFEADVKKRVTDIEQGIKKWTDEGKLTKDVFMKDPTFIKFWESLPEEHKSTSCIANFYSK